MADEIKLGRDAQKEIQKKTPVLSGPVAAYVSSIGRTLAAHAGGPKYPYSFSVANYKDINAFALPGGPVWIDRGAIEATQNEAQLAGVLAHEIAHVSERHAAQQISNGIVANGLLSLFGALLGNVGGARTAQSGAQALAGGYMLKFSRDDERAADRAGAAIMRRAGWDANAMLAFMEILRREQGRDPGAVEVFLSTHPSPAERVDRLRAELRGVHGGTRDSATFQRMKKTLVRQDREVRRRSL